MKKAVFLVAFLAAIVPSLPTWAGDEPVLYDDPQMTARLDSVGLVINWGVQKLYPKWQGKLSYRVYDDADLNAGAYPDGRVFVSKGMMAATSNSDDELIAVLNHEATHVVQKHGRAQAKKNIIWRLGTLLLGRAIGASADTADTASQVVTGIAAGGYSRKDENRADIGSVDLCAAAGIDPYAPSRVLKMLQGKYGNGSAKTPAIGWFASHPDTGARIARVAEQAKKYVDQRGQSPLGTVPIPVVKPKPFGGIAVIVRDNAGGGGFGWGGYGSSEQAVKTTMEAALQQTGRFTIVDQSGREDAWQEQDLGDTGRMDPKTTPRKGKTHGAKWFLYVTLNYYQVTEEGQTQVNVGNNRADARLIKAEIKGIAALEPVEKSVVSYTTSFHGREVGYEADASVRNDNWQNGIDVGWVKQPAGQAVEAACRKAVANLVGWLDSKMPASFKAETALPTPTTVAPPSAPTKVEKDVEFILHIAPLISEYGVAEVTTTLIAPEVAVNAADYILFLYKDKVGQNVVLAKINIARIRGKEVWGTIEFPYLSQLDLSKIQFVRLMKSD